MPCKIAVHLDGMVIAINNNGSSIVGGSLMFILIFYWRCCLGAERFFAVTHASSGVFHVPRISHGWGVCIV